MSAPLPGRTSDIGPGGVCLETPSPFALASLRRIEIELPDGVLHSRVEGRWQRESPSHDVILSGVQFQGQDRETGRRLWSFVQLRAGELAGFLIERTGIAGLELDEALDLTFFTRVVEFQIGKRIYAQGVLRDRGDSAYIVRSGHVVFEAQSRRGRKVHLGRAEVGDVFGGLPLVGSRPHVETAIADRDVVLLEIDAYTFRYLQTAKPAAAQRLAEALVRVQATRIEDLIERLTAEDRR